MPGFCRRASMRWRLFYLRCRMFDFDFRRLFICIALLGAVVGGAVTALVLVAWPWL